MPQSYTMATPSTSVYARSSDSGTCLALVAQNTEGASYLSGVDLHVADTGETAFHKIRNEYKSMTKSGCKETWLSKIFTRAVVGTAEIQRVCGRPKPSSPS